MIKTYYKIRIFSFLWSYLYKLSQLTELQYVKVCNPAYTRMRRRCCHLSQKIVCILEFSDMHIVVNVRFLRCALTDISLLITPMTITFIDFVEHQFDHRDFKHISNLHKEITLQQTFYHVKELGLCSTVQTSSDFGEASPSNQQIYRNHLWSCSIHDQLLKWIKEILHWCERVLVPHIFHCFF